jgi:hypothetical protein
MECPYCHGKGHIFNEREMSRHKLVKGIKSAIRDAEKTGQTDAAQDLIAVITFLPEYPILAALEAEARGLDADFVHMIRDVCDVRPLV